jgi:mono/diheme cytochrome c family protein
MKRGLFAGLVLALIAASPVAAQIQAMEGERIARQWCAHCHQVSEDTIARDLAPSFLNLANRNPDNLNWVRTRLQNPLYPMAGINLSNMQIEAVTAYFETLREE